MADEIKETAGTETPEQAPKKKKSWKGKRLPIVIAAVVVGNIIKLYNLIFNKLTKKSAKKKTDANRSSAAKLSPANNNLSLQSK